MNCNTLITMFSRFKIQLKHTKIRPIFVIFFVLLASTGFSQIKDSSKTVIYHFQIKEMIAPGAARTVKNAIEAAEKQNADYLIMELNTYGGLVDAADSIRTALITTEIPTISWINNNAASAGALVSIACDSIYMAKGANIGAATVVDGQGKQAPDKYQSYMRSTMRSTAEAQGRDPKIAEAMVDDRIEIDGLTKEGEVITFTTSEAIANNYCEGQADSLDELITKRLGVDDYTVVEHQLSFTDKIIAFLLNPIVSSVLMFMMVGGIWFELQSPGVGFPIAAAIIGAILYFMPLYLEGLAENWEIALFAVGILLLIAEIFIIPGFGIAGILGIIAIFVALTFSLIHNDFFDFSPEGLSVLTMPLIRVMLTFITLIVGSILLAPVLFKNSSFKKLMLQTETSKERGFTVEERILPSLVGKTAVVANELKPMGRIEIDGEYYYARSQAGWVNAGEQVKIIRVDVNNLVVQKI